MAKSQEVETEQAGGSSKELDERAEGDSTKQESSSQHLTTKAVDESGEVETE